MEQDIFMFCNKISSLSPQQKKTYAISMLQDIPKIEMFVDKFFHYETLSLPDDNFLAVLNFAVEEMSVPFILYLNVQEFCILIENRCKRLKPEEKEFLKQVFEKMFEKFLDFENLESNVDNIERLVNVYLEIFNCDLSHFYNARKGSKNSQTEFEKLFNSAKTKIKKVNAEIQNDLSIEHAMKLIAFLNSLEISLKFGQNPGQQSILKDLLEEKETLMMILKSFVPETVEPKKILKKDNNEEVKSNNVIVIEDEDYKIHKKIKSDDVKKPKEKRLEEYTSLAFHSHVIFPEDIETEYKNYYFPLDDKHRAILRKTICGFLNTNGGRIYIGIRDEDQCILGLELTTKEQDVIRLVIDDLLKEITPKPNPDECLTKFVPLKTEETNQFIPGCYVVKIIVKRGKLNDLYFTTNGFTYERRFGKNQILEPHEFKKVIIERSQISDGGNKENLEYNKKFMDPEPEIGIPKFMKIESKNKNKFSQLIKDKKDKAKHPNQAFIKGKQDFNKSGPKQFFNNNNNFVWNRNQEQGNMQFNPKMNEKPIQNKMNSNEKQANNQPNKIPEKQVVSNSSVIFLGAAGLDKEVFEKKFFADLHRNIKELLSGQIKRIILIKEKNKVFIEALDRETAFLLHDIISETLGNQEFRNNQCILDWANMEQYYQILAAKKYVEIQI